MGRGGRELKTVKYNSYVRKTHVFIRKEFLTKTDLKREREREKGKGKGQGKGMRKRERKMKSKGEKER